MAHVKAACFLSKEIKAIVEVEHSLARLYSCRLPVAKVFLHSRILGCTGKTHG